MARKQLVDIDMNGRKVTNLAAPTNGEDASNKTYVDLLAGRLNVPPIEKTTEFTASLNDRHYVNVRAADADSVIVNLPTITSEDIGKTLLFTNTSPAGSSFYIRDWENELEASSNAWGVDPNEALILVAYKTDYPSRWQAIYIKDYTAEIQAVADSVTGLVPYSGATQTLNLNGQQFTGVSYVQGQVGSTMHLQAAGAQDVDQSGQQIMLVAGIGDGAGAGGDIYLSAGTTSTGTIGKIILNPGNNTAGNIAPIQIYNTYLGMSGNIYASGLTASRDYILPDNSGTFATQEWVAANSTGGSLTLSDGQYIGFINNQMRLEANANLGNGALFITGDNPDLQRSIYASGNLSIYSNAGATGSGISAPELTFYSDNVEMRANGVTGAYFNLYMENGLRIRTTQAYGSSLRSDNVTIDRVLQLPDADGIIATQSYVDDAVAGGGSSTPSRIESPLSQVVATNGGNFDPGTILLSRMDEGSPTTGYATLVAPEGLYINSHTGIDGSGTWSSNLLLDDNGFTVDTQASTDKHITFTTGTGGQLLFNAPTVQFNNIVDGVVNIITPATAGGTPVSVTLPSTAGTIALTSQIPSTAGFLTASSTDTLTNKSISGATNTLSAIPNGALTNSSVTIGSTNVALGATAATLAGLTLTTPTIADFTNAQHAHSSAATGGVIPIANTSGTLTVARGGTGRTTATTAYGLIAAGTTATGIQQTIAPGTAGHFLKSAGASALASFAAITLADLSDSATVATLTGTQTLTNKTLAASSNTITGLGITNLGAITGTPSSSNFLRGDGTWAAPAGGGGGDMLLGTAQTVTAAKTFNSSTLLLAGSTSGTATLNAPAVAGTITLTLPSASDILVGRATTDTLTNKSIALGSNTVTGTLAQLNTAITDDDVMGLANAQTITGVKTFGAGTLMMTSSNGTGEPYSDANPPQTLNFTDIASAVTPPTGQSTLYTTDGKSLKHKDQDGTEYTVASMATTVVRVVHGSVASTARPANATYVEWVGSVAPTNANTTNDTWIDTA